MTQFPVPAVTVNGVREPRLEPDAVTGPDLAPAQPGGRFADELNAGLLAFAYPQFVVLAIPPGHGRAARWLVRRKNPADPGLYLIMTADLDEACEALAADSPPPGPVMVLGKAAP
jgi:hypothetical protein